MEVVNYLVEKGDNIHARTDDAVRLAAGNGHLEIVKFLVSIGANYNWAVRWAAKNGHLDVVKFLVEYGANKINYSY